MDVGWKTCVLGEGYFAVVCCRFWLYMEVAQLLGDKSLTMIASWGPYSALKTCKENEHWLWNWSVGGERRPLWDCPGAIRTLTFLKSPCAVDDRWTTELHLSVRDRLVNRMTVVFIPPFTVCPLIWFISIKHSTKMELPAAASGLSWSIKPQGWLVSKQDKGPKKYLISCTF